MPLKKGQWVKIKNHETYGTIVEQRRGDAELPEPERSYKIHVEEQTLYYPPSHFEVVSEPTPERVSVAERHVRINEAAEKYMASPNPANTTALLKALEEAGYVKGAGN